MEKADLIIFSGQSNMQGSTGIVPVPYIVEKALEYRYNTDTLIPLTHPVGEFLREDNDNPESETYMSPPYGYAGCMVPSFCFEYIKHTDANVVAVHAAQGATSLADWNPGGKRFKKLIDKVEGALKALKERFELGNVYLLWHQGESDAINHTSENEYCDKLKKFYNAVNQKIALDKFMFVRVGRFCKNEYDFAIIRAQEKLCKENNEFAMLTRITGYLMEDNYYINPYVGGHYNNEAQEIIGAVCGYNAARISQGKAPILEEEPYKDLYNSAI